jgi:2-aminoadipate transaminase
MNMNLSPNQNQGQQFRFAPHMVKIPSNPIFHLLPKLNEPGFISFAPGAPSSDSFPYADIEEITRGLLSNNPRELMQYGSTEGYAPARKSMAALISRYGLSPKPGEVIVTTGGQQAIDLLCKLFVEPGDVVLVEAPTYSATLQILKSYRAVPISIEADDDGILPGDLEEKIKIFAPKLIYLIPTFQNPSGRTLTLERRAAAAEIAGRHNVLLIEDDPYRDLRYHGEHLPTIKSFDTADHVIFLTSTSKILCPGLRVGAAYAPEALIPALTVAKQAADMHSPALPQAIVSAYLDRGLLDAHLSLLCGQYRRKLDAMLDAVKRFFPEGIEYRPPQGGLFLWCVCPERLDTAELLERAVDEKVAFVPGEQFFADERVTNTLRLNFSNAPEADIPKGIEILGKLLRKSLAP